jgi:dimethylhistidine N-methyltransferase
MSSMIEPALPDNCQGVFLNEVLNGLSQKQKALPCKYFYDDNGAQLFEQITVLPEYYPTRTELSILAKFAKDIASKLPPNATVIEPGCGSGQKVAYLLNELPNISSFIPLEISTEMLSFTQTRLQKRFAHVPIHPLHGDFTHSDTIKDLVTEHRLSSQANVVFFPGSTLGNFSPSDSVGILENLRILSGKEGSVLIGIDLLKDEERMIAAYDDEQDITAAFNKNMLTRLQRELGADLNIDDFEHEARFNSHLSRIEMHLVANKATHITINERRFDFVSGESIHTENSHKYSVQSFLQLACAAGLGLIDIWHDPQKDFALCLLAAT